MPTVVTMKTAPPCREDVEAGLRAHLLAEFAQRVKGVPADFVEERLAPLWIVATYSRSGHGCWAYSLAEQSFGVVYFSAGDYDEFEACEVPLEVLLDPQGWEPYPVDEEWAERASDWSPGSEIGHAQAYREAAALLRRLAGELEETATRIEEDWRS